MRILFLGPASASHATRWVHFLHERGHDIRLGTMHAIPDEHAELSVPLAPKLGQGATSWRSLLAAVPRARRLVREFDPDLVVAYYMSSYGFLAALSGARPWVGAAAGGDILVDDFDPWHRRLRNALTLRYTVSRCTAMVTWGQHLADRLVELGVPKDDILVQPRGANRELFRLREPRQRGTSEPLRVLSIRWLKPLYRVDTLIDALGELKKRGVPFEARIGGEGPVRPQLESQTRSLGLNGQVHFVGSIEADDVPQAMDWADVYVSTSSSDGASSSLFEAMSVGCYPIVTDIVANHPFVDPGQTGAMFALGDVQALADRLEAVARDDAARREAIARARPFVDRELSYAQNMAKIERFLVSVAQRDSGS